MSHGDWNTPELRALRDTVTGEEREQETTGLFIAIGHLPRNELVTGQIELDDEGYVVAQERSTHTNVDGVFACGDLVDHTYRQAITAAGSGCQAALDAERYLSTLDSSPVEHAQIEPAADERVPGGLAPLVSSVLMNVVPAQVSGVGSIALASPPQKENHGELAGYPHPTILAACALLGVDEVYAMGGAQAVAAFAYGFSDGEELEPVDLVTGPGNAYVASAKKHVFGQVGIDMIAGPSEILVLADGTTPPDWVAMDLFSQAEHDELAQSILLCPDDAFIARVRDAINELLPTMPRQDVIRASLEGRGALIKVRDMAEACAIANDIAPEHLEISALEPHQWGQLIRHAGAIFLGRYTSESLGDYCAGPNHVLPTSRTARFSSPLGVYDFFKRSSVIEVSAEGAQTLGEIAAELAYGEGLQAHARSAEYRMRQGG